MSSLRSWGNAPAPAVVLVASLALALGANGCKKSAGHGPHAHAGHGGDGAAEESATVAAGGTITVRVDGTGYHPAQVRAPRGSEVTLSFLRTTDECCGQQLKVPSMNITRDLPLNQPVAVTLRVPNDGSLAFTCGMDMYRGSIVVQ